MKNADRVGWASAHAVGRIMRGQPAFLGLVLCLLLSTLPGRSLSQTRAPQSRAEGQRWLEEQKLKNQQRHEEFLRNAEKQRLENEQRHKVTRKMTDEYTDEAYQEALGATPEQWKVIKPRFERVKKLAGTPCIGVGVYSFGASASGSAQGATHSSGAGNATGGSGGHYAFGAGGSSRTDTQGSFSAGSGGRTTNGSQSFNSGTAGSVGGGFAGGSAQGFGGSGAGFSGGGDRPVRKRIGDMNFGWQWQRPSLDKSPETLSASEETCERLLDVLEGKNPDPAQVRARIEELRQARAQRQAEQREARQELRAVVTPEQEARLILMGYLD